MQWRDVVSELQQSPGLFLRTDKSAIVHPLSAGAYRSIGLPRGQLADFRWTLADCQGVHVQEYADHYETHLDAISPACDPIGHLQVDAPRAFLALSAAVGALVGAVLSGPRLALLGAAAGVLLAGLKGKPPEHSTTEPDQIGNPARWTRQLGA